MRPGKNHRARWRRRRARPWINSTSPTGRGSAGPSGWYMALASMNTVERTLWPQFTGMHHLFPYRVGWRQEVRIGEADHSGLLAASLRRPHNIPGDPDDAVLLAEQLERLDGLFGEADNSARREHQTFASSSKLNYPVWLDTRARTPARFRGIAIQGHQREYVCNLRRLVPPASRLLPHSASGCFAGWASAIAGMTMQVS
jgi:hypothetical protein